MSLKRFKLAAWTFKKCCHAEVLKIKWNPLIFEESLLNIENI